MYINALKKIINIFNFYRGKKVIRPCVVFSNIYLRMKDVQIIAYVIICMNWNEKNANHMQDN